MKTRFFSSDGFTLFELMVSMAIFALLMISVLESVGSIGIIRQKWDTKITLLQELYFFSEKLASAIKDGGTVDYEEYWNRQVVGSWGTQSWHYARPTGFGNYGQAGVISTVNNFDAEKFWSGFYFCRSGVGIWSKVWTWGCVEGKNSFWNTQSPDTNYTGAYQRYGQYGYQFWDYNGNYDADMGNEDGDMSGNILQDEDDTDIGNGPVALSGAMSELYLINHVTLERTYFRWTYRQDPDTVLACDPATGDNCLGNIEMLRLIGKDLGMSHSGDLSQDSTAYDGKIDTWVCHLDWRCSGPALPSPNSIYRLPASTGSTNEWIPLFPDYVNVRSLSFTVYPQKDPVRSWNASDCVSGTCPADYISTFINPYVKIQMNLGLAWSKRSVIRGDNPTISVSTTINLSNLTQ